MSEFFITTWFKFAGENVVPEPAGKMEALQ